MSITNVLWRRSWYREYTAQKYAWKDAREIFRAEFRSRQRGAHVNPTRFEFPTHLQGPFPVMSTWIKDHVSTLREAEFPIPMEVVALSLPPDTRALSYNAMWAYGAHFRTDRHGDTAYVTFDSGIAHITEDGLADAIDVGILKSILYVKFGTMTAVVMKGEWYEKKDHGRTTIKKDRYGFWTVKSSARGDPNMQNPFAYPEHINQVYFMTDHRDPDALVVIKNDIRSVRVVGERDSLYFGASGSEDGNLLTTALPSVYGDSQPADAMPQFDFVRAETVNALDASIRVQADHEELADDELSEGDFEEIMESVA